MCRALAARGHDVRVLCVEGRRAPDYSLREDLDAGVRVQRVNLPYLNDVDPEGWSLGLVRWRRHERRVALLLAGLVDDWRPDVVDYHTCRPLGETCVISLAERGIPVVATLHEYWLVCPRVMLMRSPTGEICPGPRPHRCLFCLYSQYDGVSRALLKLPWRVLRLGGYRAYRLRRRGLARSRIAAGLARSAFVARAHAGLMHGPVVHFPLGIGCADHSGQRPARPREPFRFGFLGGSQPTKGLEDVLEAARALARAGHVFELRVWGPLDGAVASTPPAAELGGRLELLGLFAPEQRSAVYEQIDAALMASTACEPLGRIPLEAAAAGVPTIAPDVGGIGESIRDGVDGLLYPFRRRDELQERMRRLILEPGLYASLAANLRRPLDTVEAIPKLEAFYRSALAREGPASSGR